MCMALTPLDAHSDITDNALLLRALIGVMKKVLEVL